MGEYLLIRVDDKDDEKLEMVFQAMEDSGIPEVYVTDVGCEPNVFKCGGSR